MHINGYDVSLEQSGHARHIWKVIVTGERGKQPGFLSYNSRVERWVDEGDFDETLLEELRCLVCSFVKAAATTTKHV